MLSVGRQYRASTYNIQPLDILPITLLPAASHARVLPTLPDEPSWEGHYIIDRLRMPKGIPTFDTMKTPWLYVIITDICIDGGREGWSGGLEKQGIVAAGLLLLTARCTQITATISPCQDIDKLCGISVGLRKVSSASTHPDVKCVHQKYVLAFFLK
ncbi:hypothetical protein FIBSPDRAFT_987882 [Athelia psychrophila]|uniref:Uncharacterized protein n=1 Tax=Athelia psychrophila TaxID=1759441 RepID=A0A167SIG5_9AGAM|nr:hypothetical protein FIBSPDRAFT_987882 [Fibularhizoctonia sp. CBS 109695]